MNNVQLLGRLTADPKVTYTQGNEPMCVARYTVAVDRPARSGQEKQTDFISCVAFGKNGEFAEKYLNKGGVILVQGRIQTGNYTNKDGAKIYTTDVVVERHEFVPGTKNTGNGNAQEAPQEAPASEPAPAASGDFMDAPDDEELPFN